MSETILVKCGDCGKCFPVNTWKHPYRTEVFCPWCKTPHTHSFFDPAWKPNKKYWEKRKERGFSRPFTLTDMRRILSGLFKR